MNSQLISPDGKPNLTLYTRDQLARAQRYLLEARALIAKGWTRESYARLADGQTTVPADEKAVCFCSLGALHKVRNLAVTFPLDGFADYQALRYITGPVAVANDRAESVDEMLICFDRAVALIGEHLA